VQSMNQVSLMKVESQICNRKDDLWVRIIRAKYKCGSSVIPWISQDRIGSNFWRGMCKNWNHVNQNLHCRLHCCEGNGLKVDFWYDKWPPPQIDKLKAYVIQPNSMEEAAIFPPFQISQFEGKQKMV